MKKKIAALLCAMALAVPALCISEMSDTGYTCDACKYAGSFLMVVTGTETIEGIPGEWITVQCPQCGALYTSYWRPTGEAEVPSEPKPQENPAPAAPAEPAVPVHEPSQDTPENPAEPEVPAVPPQEPSPDTPVSPAEPETPAVPPQEVSPDPDPAEPEAPAAPPQEVSPDTDVSPAEPEAPVALPQESATDTSGSGNGGQQPEPAVVLPAENQQPSGPQEAESFPPVPADNPDPAPANPPSVNESSADEPSGQEQPRQEAPTNSGTGKPAGNASGDSFACARRNIRKYPYFSAVYPSRRLAMECDPEALAPIPGMRVYPEPAAEGSSILQHMLDGN